MTIKELMEELNELIENGEVNENAIIRDAEGDDIFSITSSTTHNNEVVIYF